MHPPPRPVLKRGTLRCSQLRCICINHGDDFRNVVLSNRYDLFFHSSPLLRLGQCYLAKDKPSVRPIFDSPHDCAFTMSLPARLNPFRTECLDRLAYDPGDESLEAIVDRLKTMNFRAALVGPHGTGKSTCLRAIAGQLPALGLTPLIHRLDGERLIPSLWSLRRLARQCSRSTVLILDGADHLPPIKARYICRATRSAGGLIITSHAPWHLPTLLTTHGYPELLARLINRLTGQGLSPDEAQSLLQSREGNIREVLFDLYDQIAGIPAE